MSRQMIKQYSRSQIKQIREDLAALFPPGRVTTAEDMVIIHQQLKHRKSPLADALEILQQVAALVQKKKLTLDDIDKVIIWEGDPPAMQIEYRRFARASKGSSF